MRLTRNHSKIKRGASIRAAISIAQNLDKGEEKFKLIAKSALANRIELLTGKYSNQPYSDLLDDVLKELFESLHALVKKKP